MSITLLTAVRISVSQQNHLFVLHSSTGKYFRAACALLALLFCTSTLSAQTYSVTWDFGTSGSPTRYASSSTNANVPAGNCDADTGNVCCAFVPGSYTPVFLWSGASANSYTGKSGEPTIRNNAKNGAFNVNTSTYFSFYVRPNTGYSVKVTGIEFAGYRINAVGPAQYTVRSSTDGFTANVGNSTFGTNFGGAKYSHTSLSLTGAANAPVEMRIYTHNGIATATSGNVILDDVIIYYELIPVIVTGTIATGTVTGSPFCSGAAVSVPFTVTGTFNSGNIFTAQLSDATGSFSSPVNIGTLNSTTSGSVNATIPSGTLAGTGYRIRVVSSNPVIAGGDNGTDISIVPTVTPTVTASANPGTTVCAGNPTTFTANITNGGTTPTYQWKKNNINVGTNSDTYTDNSIANGDNITVVMASSATCATPASVTATALSMTVNASATNSASITATATNICPATPVTFTATVPTSSTGPVVSIPGSALTCTNSMIATSSCVGAGGSYASGWSSSDYWQYKVNTTGYGNIVFNTPTSSSNTGPHNGALYYSTNGTTFTFVTNYTWGSGTTCGSTGNINLPAAADNQPALYVRLVMTGATNTGGTNRVNPNAFKGQAVQQGITPVFQWKKNGNNVGTNSSTYTDNSLADNDDVWVEVSSTTCATPAVATSNIITMTVNPTVTPSVSIAASATTICAGISVTFTATPVNGGTSPVYQWKVNGVNAGSNSNTFTSSTLSNNDVVTCQMTSTEPCPSPATVTSNAVNMTVNPVLTASVNIAASATAICAGTGVTITATPTNGGSLPVYQWKKNSSNVGTNSATYTDNTLANGDIITVVMTSNATCASPASVTSNAVNMSVSTPLTPAVSIAASTGSTICNGTAVTFTATPANGGASPSYQWKKNNVNVGTNSATYNDNALANGDIITVVMTSNAICLATPTATGTGITMTVNPIIVPSVTTTVGPDDTICDGTMTTFTAVPVNEGNAPIYQWKKNNISVGGNSITYTDNALVHGDVITFTMTSNATCATPATLTSTPINMTVNPLLPTSVAVALTPNDTICAGTPVTFTAKFVNGGVTPTFQWKKNNVNVGNSSATYDDNGLVNGDMISVIMNSNAVCATPPIVSSQVPVAITVGHVYHPSITLVAKPGNVVGNNEMVYFTAYITDAGSNPKIHWEINGKTIPGVKGDNYFSSIMSNNDTIACIVESIDTCSIGNTGISNRIVMAIGTGINDVANTFKDITLFPNPNKGTFTIKGEVNTSKEIKIEVMNAIGQVVYTATYPVSGNMLDQQIVLPETAKGAYLMRVQAEAEQKVMRFIVQ